jgi:hypothetical protein
MEKEERATVGRGVLRDVCDIHEPSYMVVGDNLGGREQRATDRYICIDYR